MLKFQHHSKSNILHNKRKPFWKKKVTTVSRILCGSLFHWGKTLFETWIIRTATRSIPRSNASSNWRRPVCGWSWTLDVLDFILCPVYTPKITLVQLSPVFLCNGLNWSLAIFSPDCRPCLYESEKTWHNQKDSQSGLVWAKITPGSVVLCKGWEDFIITTATIMTFALFDTPLQHGLKY